VTNQNLGRRPLSSVRLHYNDPADAGIARVSELVVRGTITQDRALALSHVNQAAKDVIAMREAAKASWRAQTKVAKGDYAGADAELASIERQLKQNAKQSRSNRSRAYLYKAARRVARSRSSVRASRARPKPAQPAQRRARALELNDQAMDFAGF